MISIDPQLIKEIVEKGKRLDVACILGADPTLLFSAACPLPYGIDEFSLAGFLRGEQVEVVRAKTILRCPPSRKSYWKDM